MLRAFNLLTNVPAMILLGLALFLPIYGPLMVDIEGAAFPVTSRITVTEAEARDGQLFLRFSFDKHRACELVGVEARYLGKRVGFKRADNAEQIETIRPGESVSPLWRLDAPSLSGVSVYWVHRCHPFWLTVTKVFGE